MSGSLLVCSQCGKALALADTHCLACGAPAPAEARMAVLGAKADADFDAGRYDGSARAYLQLLQGEPPADLAKLWWRKRALSLQRSGIPGQGDAVARAFEASLKLDDADPLSHQLWIDALAKEGRGAEAKAWYEQRLQADPADAVALKQMQVLKLAGEMAVLAPPKLDLDAGRKPGFIERSLRPSPMKKISAWVTLLGSLGMLMFRPGLDGDMGAALGALGGPQGQSLQAMAADPWIHILSIAAAGAYLWWARSRG